jgi:hypothetical protein
MLPRRSAHVASVRVKQSQGLGADMAYCHGRSAAYPWFKNDVSRDTMRFCVDISVAVRCHVVIRRHRGARTSLASWRRSIAT